MSSHVIRSLRTPESAERGPDLTAPGVPPPALLQPKRTAWWRRGVHLLGFLLFLVGLVFFVDGIVGYLLADQVATIAADVHPSDLENRRLVVIMAGIDPVQFRKECGRPDTDRREIGGFFTPHAEELERAARPVKNMLWAAVQENVQTRGRRTAILGIVLGIVGLALRRC